MKKSVFGFVATLGLCVMLVSLAGVSTPGATTSISIFGLPQNIGPGANSGDNESGTAIAPNGLSLYFSSSRPGGLGSIDLWVSQRTTLTSAWGSPQNLTMLNSDSNENLPSLSPDGKTIFFSCSCPNAEGGTDIYISTRPDPNNDLGWTAPVNLGTAVNSASGEIAATYFEDPTNGTGILYFTSDRLGDEDIYESTRNANGTFNVPTSVTTLNSPATDRGVALRRDGLEILFSTDREGGAGGRDIWVATRASLSASWDPPVNLADVSSSGSDQSPSLSSDGSTLYLSSSRDGGSGSNDIYSVTRISVNRTSTADFDGDGRTDLSVFRPSDGMWHVMESGTSTFRSQQFGSNGDRVVPGDYDGDGRTDLGIFRPTDKNWYIKRSSDGAVSVTNWGLATDRLVPGDYDGDGRTDIAVFRDGNWYLNQSTGGIAIRQYGLAGDIPIAGIQ